MQAPLEPDLEIGQSVEHDSEFEDHKAGSVIDLFEQACHQGHCVAAVRWRRVKKPILKAQGSPCTGACQGVFGC